MTQVWLMAGVVFGLMVGLAFGELREGPWPSDPELAKVEAQIKKEAQPCDKIKNPMRSMDCHGKVRRGFYAKGLVRGTEEYVQKHYEDLPTKALVEKRRELIALKDRARTRFSSQYDREPGELSEEKLATEIQLIEVEMGRRASDQYDENLKFLKGLKKD